MFCLPQLTYVLFTDTIYKNCIRIRWDYLIYYFQHGRKSTCNIFSRATCLFGYLSQLTIAYMVHGRWTRRWQIQSDKFYYFLRRTQLTCFSLCGAYHFVFFSLSTCSIFFIFSSCSFFLFPNSFHPFSFSFLFPRLVYPFIYYSLFILFSDYEHDKHNLYLNL